MSGKKIWTCLLSAMLVMPLTGCNSDLINYITREDPYDAMEEYIEEKYGIEVTVVETQAGSNFMQAFWHTKAFNEKVTCNEIQGREINIAACVNDDNEYDFYDDYQYFYHLQEIEQLTENDYLAPLEHYVKVYRVGGMLGEDVPIMSLSEYTSNYEVYGICLLVKEKDSENITTIAKNWQEKMSENQVQCEYCVGVVSDEIEDIEEYASVNGEFDPWTKGKVQWLLEMPYDGDWEVQTE